MEAYNHIVGYLHRWTLCKLGKLHIRIHHILSTDGTPFLHNHPFWYLSFVWRGAYTEQVLIDDTLITKQHVAPALILRKPSTYHRIVDVQGKCKTLFFAWSSGDWSLLQHDKVEAPSTYDVPCQSGIYQRYINGSWVYSKFDNGVWWTGALTKTVALASTKVSIYQAGEWEECND